MLKIRMWYIIVQQNIFHVHTKYSLRSSTYGEVLSLNIPFLENVNNLGPFFSQ